MLFHQVRLRQGNAVAVAWIEARGKKFTPPRKTTLAPHGQNFKSIIYSPARLLHPMKRVDFDPNGERNPQNRGISGYKRISWDEAFDLVAGKRELRKVAVSAAQLGEAETVDMTIAVDKTFVPAATPALKSSDARELGIRVFRVYVQPR